MRFSKTKSFLEYNSKIHEFTVINLVRDTNFPPQLGVLYSALVTFGQKPAKWIKIVLRLSLSCVSRHRKAPATVIRQIVQSGRCKTRQISVAVHGDILAQYFQPAFHSVVAGETEARKQHGSVNAEHVWVLIWFFYDLCDALSRRSCFVMVNWDEVGLLYPKLYVFVPLAAWKLHLKNIVAGVSS